MVYIEQFNEYGNVVYRNGKKEKDWIELETVNDSEFFYEKAVMQVSAKDLYNLVPIRIYKPETGSTRGERIQYLIIMDKREIEMDNLNQDAEHGFYLLGVIGEYETTDSAPSIFNYGEAKMIMITVEKKFNGEIQISNIIEF
jgi:hypothetical protein